MNDKKLIGKNIFDFIFSLIGTIILSPFLLIISLIIKLTSKGPILFKQQRVGKNGKLFNILKFRTMVPDAEAKGLKITVGEDPRITGIGKFLRKYKLDELPQIINILIGDMSFVGPRPEVKRYVDLYTDEQKKVLTVRPGVTDLASVLYKDENKVLGMSENPEKTYIEEIMQNKLKINLDYVKNISLINDIKLIFMTVKEVFLGDRE